MAEEQMVVEYMDDVELDDEESEEEELEEEDMAEEQDIPYPEEPEGDPHYFCRKCHDDGVITEITLINMCEKCNDARFDGFQVIRAYYVENVCFDEKRDQEDQILDVIGQRQLTKTLDMFCNVCNTKLGWLQTDPLGVVSWDMGEHYRDHILNLAKLKKENGALVLPDFGLMT